MTTLLGSALMSESYYAGLTATTYCDGGDHPRTVRAEATRSCEGVIKQFLTTLPVYSSSTTLSTTLGYFLPFLRDIANIHRYIATNHRKAENKPCEAPTWGKLTVSAVGCTEALTVGSTHV